MAWRSSVRPSRPLATSCSTTPCRSLRSGASGREDLRELCIQWMMDHYDAIAAKAPPEYVARLISVAGISDAATFDRVRTFLYETGGPR